MSILSSLKGRLVALLQRELKAVREYFKPILDTIVQNGGQVLMTSALNAIKAAEAAGGSGGAKMSMALNLVKSDLLAQGKPYVETVVRGAIEALLVGLIK